MASRTLNFFFALSSSLFTFALESFDRHALITGVGNINEDSHKTNVTGFFDVLFQVNFFFYT